MSSEVYRATFSANIQLNTRKPTALHFTVQMDNGWIRSIEKETQDFLMEETWNCLQWPVSRLIWLIAAWFLLTEDKSEPSGSTNKQLQKVAAVKTWQSIFREETWLLVRSTGSRLQAVINAKGSTQVLTIVDIFTIMSLWSITFKFLKMEVPVLKRL